MVVVGMVMGLWVMGRKIVTRGMWKIVKVASCLRLGRTGAQVWGSFISVRE